MKKEIYKFPYNARIEDENKKFLSDSISNEIITLNFRTGRIFWELKYKITARKREIVVAAAFGLAGLRVCPKSGQTIGLPTSTRVISSAEVHRIIPEPVYKYAPIVPKRVERIRLLPTKEMIPLIYLNAKTVYVNETILRKLRAGDMTSNLTVIAIGIVVFAMCQLIGVDAFTPMFTQFQNWNAPQTSPSFWPTSTEVGVIPTKAQEFNDMLLEFNKPKDQFVLTKKEALEKIAKTYPGEMEISENEKITDWQATKHIYHGKGVGIDPEMYGITQEQLMEIGKPGGLSAYVRKGGQLPSIEHVRAYQQALKDICENSQKRTNSKYYSKNGVRPATVYYNKNQRFIISFDQTTGDLITGDKQRQSAFNRFMTDNTLGGLEWIIKWNNN